MMTYSLLLLCLAERRGSPSDDDGIDRVCADREDEAGNVPAGCVECAGGNDETHDCDEQAAGDVPGAFVHAAGAPARGDAGCACEEERRAGKDEGDCGAEAESFDDTEVFSLEKRLFRQNKNEESKTYVGKKELNEQALRWKFCIKQKSHVRGSLHACLSPSIMLTSSVESPMRSRSIRACASSRSRGDSQRVVNGVLGSIKKPKMATKAVTAPSLPVVSNPFSTLHIRKKKEKKEKKKTHIINNHLHPAIPLSPSIWNTPAAINPLNPVARICAQYNKAIRVATSLLV